MKVEELKNYLGRRFFTPNEAREAMGLPKLQGGSANLLILDDLSETYISQPILQPNSGVFLDDTPIEEFSQVPYDKVLSEISLMVDLFEDEMEETSLDLSQELKE